APSTGGTAGGEGGTSPVAPALGSSGGCSSVIAEALLDHGPVPWVAGTIVPIRWRQRKGIRTRRFGSARRLGSRPAGRSDSRPGSCRGGSARRSSHAGSDL